MIDQKTELERVGTAFAREKMLFVRGRVRGAIHEIAAVTFAVGVGNPYPQS